MDSMTAENELAGAFSHASWAEFATHALTIRKFELALLELFSRGLMSGTVHTCVGQEATAVALHHHLCSGHDAFFATHRGHGHYLAYGGSPEALLAEVMGREGAVCLGRGGSQHLCHERFFANGVQGAGSLQAVGFAWAQKLRGEDAITVAQLGDGTLGEGAVYEAMNLAALLQVPVLFLIECNGWAQSTDVRNTIAGTIEGRAAAFGLPFDRCSDIHPGSLTKHLKQVVTSVRAGKPFVQIIDTRRLLAHSKGDDNRPADFIAGQWEADPLTRWSKHFPVEAADLDGAVEQRLSVLIKEITQRRLIQDTNPVALPPLPLVSTEDIVAKPTHEYGTLVQELNRGLHAAMTESDSVIVLGEDIADPYGGAFKVTAGLSTRFSSRVFSTPISENGIIGLSAGAGLAGMRPVAEIMFADFVALAVDQLINSAAKFHYMYGGKVTCPLTVRLVSGGGRGYGPTHSQSTERLFCGEPGLRVVAVSQRHDPKALLRHVVLHDDAPTVFVEDKSLYSQKPLVEPPLAMRLKPGVGAPDCYPALLYTPLDDEAEVTIVSYGGIARLAEAALTKLVMEHEVFGDLVILSQIWPLDVTVIVESVRRTRRLLVIEPHVASYGVSSAVISAVMEQVDPKDGVRTVGAEPLPIPSARQLEDQVLPTTARIYKTLVELLGLL